MFKSDPNGNSKSDRVKVLRIFPSPFLLGAHLFPDISPDDCYVLVRLEQPTSREFDALNGDTRVLLEDEVDRKTAGRMSVVRWVRQGAFRPRENCFPCFRSTIATC